jgi:flagellar basal-body rod protein FlgG
MLRGLYTSASGMLAQMTRQAIVTNNINNATTTGFKQELTSQGLFWRLLLDRVQRADLPVAGATAAATPIGPAITTAGAIRATTDHAQGSLTDTGGELDLALTGPGYFAVQTPTGVQLTRDGAFTRDAQGRLVAADGALVLGVSGPLTLPDGPVAVAADGTLTVGDQAVGQLQLLDAPPEQLTRAGQNRFALLAGAAPVPATAAAVNQGFLERSNVDVTRAVTDMMSAARAYEANQRLVQIQDELLGKAVNEVGRVG